MFLSDGCHAREFTLKVVWKKQMRISKHIKNRHPELSMRMIKDHIKTGHVTVNGQMIKKDLFVDDDAEFELIGVQFALRPNPSVACKLIADTSDFIFLNKSEGVHAVAIGFNEKKSVANWLLSIDPKLVEVSSPLESGLAHRLDQGTSGVMVAARHKKAFAYIRGLFDSHDIEKQYFCVTKEQPLTGRHVAYWSQNSKSSAQVIISDDETEGDEIVTDILCVEALPGDYFGVTCGLITGRRHQIRAHLAHLSCPIVGDSLYGGESAKRLMLHADRLIFTGLDGKEIDVSAKRPAEFGSSARLE